MGNGGKSRSPLSFAGRVGALIAPVMWCGKGISASFLTTADGYAISPHRVSTRSFFFLIDNIRDRVPRRPDEQFIKVVLGSVGVSFDGFVECDAVNAEIGMPCGDRPRYLKLGCRVRVFLVIERV